MMLLEPIQSVVDFGFYREVPRRSMGRGILYILYLGLLFSGAATAAFYMKFDPALRELVDWVAANAPSLTIADGKAASDAPQPFVIRHPKAERYAVLIDTTRTDVVTAKELVDKGLIGAVTQNAVYVMPSPERLHQYYLSQAKSPKSVTIGPGFFRTVGSTIRLCLYPAVLLLGWLFFFVWKLLAALAYSIIGLLVNSTTSAGLDYEALYKIALYAQTPVVLLQATLLFLQRGVPGFPLIAWCVVGLYIWFAVRQNQASPDPQAGPA